MIYVIYFVLIAACVLLVGILYGLVRTEWVYSRRIELIDAFFGDEDFRDICENKFGSRDFQKCFGTFDDWFYKYPLCWDAKKLANLDFWVK